MKTIKFTLVLLFAIISFNMTFAQGVSINTDGSNAALSAMLDIKSTTGGLLIPRMTEAQKNAISSPATSLLVYQTDAEKGFYYYSGSSWQKLSDELKKFALISDAENASGTDNELCYVVQTETFYRYESDAATFTKDNKFYLSTADGGNSKWIGIAGKYNKNDPSLSQITHLDASSGSASITELNKIYYITVADTNTIVTIPDANTQNTGYFLRIYKEKGNGPLIIKTTSGQIVDGDTTAIIYNIGKGFYIKSDNATQWLKIQDSRKHIPDVISTTSDYNGNTQNFQFDFMTANTSSNDITVTLPSDLSSAPEGNNRMFFNTGTNRLFIDPGSNTIDGVTGERVIAPGGYMELEKIGGEIRIIREKNLTIKKDPTDIPYLECWLDASKLTGSDGTAISTWNDLKNNNDFTASGTSEPILKTNAQNGKNVVQFDGTNDVMSAGDKELYNNSRGFTIFAVVKAEDSKRMAILSKYQTTGNNREFAFGNKDNYLFEDGTWYSETYSNVTMALDDFMIVEICWKPGQPFEYYINGALAGMGDKSVSDIYDGTANLKLGGGDYSYVGFWKGDIAELLIYSNAVSDNDRKALRDNLAIKWGINQVIIADGGGHYWKRNDDSNTIIPDTQNDSLDMGSGSISGGTLNATQLLNAPALSAAPANPKAGSIYFNTTDSKLKVYTGSAWENLN